MLQWLHSLTSKHSLALSPYFTRHTENLMARGDDLVFVNPLFSSNIECLPYWIFGSIGANAKVSDSGQKGKLAAHHMVEEQFMEKTGGEM